MTLLLSSSFAALGQRVRVDSLLPVETQSSADSTKHILGVARALCASLPPLSGCFRSHPDMPMSWFIELPHSVAEGKALPEPARQVFWFLSGVSQQVYMLFRQPDMLRETLFGRFGGGADDRHWQLIRPKDGLASLADLVLTFEHEPLARSVSHLFGLIAQRRGAYSKGFLDIDRTLAWQERLVTRHRPITRL